MKIKINKKLKTAFVLAFIVCISLCSYLLFNELSNPGFEEQKSKLYSYNNKGSINYTIFLRPNDLYEGHSLGQGKLYITEFVDSIDANFTYEFSGDSDTELNGSYRIIGKVQGFTEDKEKIINIWEKEYQLTRNKTFSTVNKSYNLNENVKIDLDEYNDFVEGIIKSSKINCDTALTLLMEINIKGNTEKGPFEENITPSVVIPLNTLMFEITTNNIEKPGAIEETIQVQLPVDKGQVIFYSIIIGILSLGLIFLIFFVKTAPDKDPLEKELKKIFKKHGDRLVALTNEPTVTEVRSVRSIDDLVRLADEINKPILYKHSDDYKELNKFYVINDNETYVFELTDLFTESVSEVEDELQINTEEIKIES